MNDAAPARGQGAALHDTIGYEDAKSIFLESYPFDADPTDPNALDNQVRTLVAVGRYALDRWGAEQNAVVGKTSKGAKARALKKARDGCEKHHHESMMREASDALNSYVERHGRMVPFPVVQKEASRLLKAMERPGWRWVGREVLAALIGILTLILLSVLVTIASPRLRAEAWHNVRVIFTEPAVPGDDHMLDAQKPAPARGGPASKSDHSPRADKAVP